ncbi:MAG: hypothetical protein AAFQ42_09320 [Pseudomonadota bacterium]
MTSKLTPPTMVVAGLLTGITGAWLVADIASPRSAAAEGGNQFWETQIARQRAERAAQQHARQAQPSAPAVVSPVSSTSATSEGGLIPLSATCEASARPYLDARAKHRARHARYWRAIEQKRANRKKRRARGLALRTADYVTSFPPEYQGPKRPRCLDRARKPVTKPGKPKKSTLPVEADFRREARRLYGFLPRPASEWEYKTIYAREAVAQGLTAEQVVGVYALETGGIGPYFRQSGIFPVDQKCRPLKRQRGRPASTALSYAQLLAANTNIMAKEYGPKLAARLEAKAKTSRAGRARDLRVKAAVLRRMARDIRRGLASLKGSPWSRYRAFAKTARGRAVHALLLDADIGPVLQVHKLRKIVDGARRAGYANVSSAQLELMNLAGPGTGLEMMTRIGARMPTANFFTEGGHDRNPVVKNRTGRGLLDKLDERIRAQMSKCGSKEFLAAFRNVTG